MSPGNLSLCELPLRQPLPLSTPPDSQYLPNADCRWNGEYGFGDETAILPGLLSLEE